MRITRLLFYFAVGILLGGSCTYALGQDYAVATLTSYHFDRTKDYNERNFGAGWERQKDDWSIGTGFYRNSIDKTTLYALGGWTPFRVLGTRVGLAAGPATGYDCGHKICTIGGGLVQGEYFNLAVTPVAVALQLKWRFSAP